MTDKGKNIILNALSAYKNQYWIGLFYQDPNDQTITEISGSPYTRVAITLPSPTSDDTFIEFSPNAEILVPECQFSHVALFANELDTLPMDMNQLYKRDASGALVYDTNGDAIPITETYHTDGTYRLRFYRLDFEEESLTQ